MIHTFRLLNAFQVSVIKSMVFARILLEALATLSQSHTNALTALIVDRLARA